MGDFLWAVQWLGLLASTTGAWVQSLVGKQRCGGQKKKKKEINFSSKKIQDEQSIKFLHKVRLRTV